MLPFRLVLAALFATLALGTPAQAQQSVYEQAVAADKADDLVTARRLHAQSCEADHPLSCRELTVSQYNGHGGPKDVAGARTTAAKSCRLGSADGCGMVAQFAYEGIGGPVDHGLVRRLGEAACKAESNAARLCLFYGLALIKAEGGAKDTEGAKSAFRIACKGSYASACFELGSIHGGRYGDEINTDEMTYFIGHACVRGEPNACRVLEITQDEFAGFARTACDEGDATACRILERPE